MSDQKNNHQLLAEKAFPDQQVHPHQSAAYVSLYGVFDLLEVEGFTKQPTRQADSSAFKVLMLPLVYRMIHQLANESGSWTPLTPSYVYEIACDVYGFGSK